MVKTDPNLKPSERLIMVLDNTFSKEGFHLIKNKKAFEREFDGVIERVVVDFYTTVALIDASLSFKKTFLQIEQIHSLIFENGKGYNNGETIFSDLLNIDMNRGNSKKKNSVALFSNWARVFNTLYTDNSINSAAEFLIKRYRETIKPIFESTSTLRDLEIIYNRNPGTFCELMGWEYKKVRIGYIINWLLYSSPNEQLKTSFINGIKGDIQESAIDLMKIDEFFLNDDNLKKINTSANSAFLKDGR